MVKHGLPGATSGNKLIDPSIVAFHRKVTRIMTEERYTRWHAFTCARCGDKTAYPAISAIIAYRLSIIENIRWVQYIYFDNGRYNFSFLGFSFSTDS